MLDVYAKISFQLQQEKWYHRLVIIDNSYRRSFYRRVGVYIVQDMNNLFPMCLYHRGCACIIQNIRTLNQYKVLPVSVGV